MRVLALTIAAVLLGAPSPGTAAAAAPATVGLENAAEFRVTAECPAQITKEHTSWRCFVDMTAGDLRMQADEVDYYDTRKPDGTGERRVEARGNVVFILGEQRISGETFTMSLETGRGVLSKARGFVQPGVFLESDSLERISGKKYVARHATFTSCYQPSPRWSFTTPKATFKLDDHVFAWAVNFRVKDYKTPLLLPAFYYPIQEDQRSTGFLFPQIGYSNYLGMTLGTGFFWAMGRSMDQTLQYDRLSNGDFGGQRLTHELRYMRRQPSGGTFRSEFFWPNSGNSRQYNLNWSATQMLPLGIRATLSVNEYSSTRFQQDLQQDFGALTTRSRNSRLTLTRMIGRNNVQLNAERNAFYFPDTVNGVNVDAFERRDRLPSLRITRSAQRLGRTGIQWGYQAAAEQLGLGDQNGTDQFTRFDLLPTISRPIATTFLELTPTVRLRATRLSARERSDDETTTEVDEGGFFHEPVDRQYVEGSLELRGPRFSRVFENPTGLYSPRFKHVIGPEFGFVRRIIRTNLPKPPATDTVPPFDYEDLLPETTEIRYGIMQRLLAKRPGPTGKPIPYQVLQWRVSQTYYVIEAASNFDPNYLSSRFNPFFEQAEPQKLSPIRSDLRFTPTAKLGANFNAEYNLKFHAFQSLGVNGQLDLGFFALNGGWSRSVHLTNRLENRRVLFNTVNGGGRLDLVPGKLRFEASGAYDHNQKRLLHRTLGLRYDVQCCGFFVQHQQFNYTGEKRNRFSFQVQLANIGSVGNFGQDEGFGPRGLGMGGGR